MAKSMFFALVVVCALASQAHAQTNTLYACVTNSKWVDPDGVGHDGMDQQGNESGVGGADPRGGSTGTLFVRGNPFKLPFTVGIP